MTTLIEYKTMRIKIVFTDNNQVCWKIIIDAEELRLDEALVNIEKQYQLK